MRIAVLAVFLLLLCSHAHAYQYWNDIRHSALLPDSTVSIRAENVSGAGVENYLLYNEGGVQEVTMSPMVDGPSTLQAAAPGPIAALRYYGFRLLQNGNIDLMPVRIPDGVDPEPGDLTRIAVDDSGDEAFGYTNLDIVDCRMSFSGDRLYGSLTNVGGGFPVIQGLTFFGYLIGIADPAVADPDTVLGLMYTFEQAGIITPGLYKITGPGVGDLVKLGEIVVEEFPASNTLRLSCELADLMDDPYFMSWYDTEDPVIDVAGFTQRITILGGPAEADRSPGGLCAMRELGIGSGANHLPDLANLTLQGEGPAAVAMIDYSDADANCPVIAEIVFDGGISYPMYPATLDYTATVTYSTEPGIDPLADSAWTTAVLVFSDNLSDSVRYEAPGVGVPAGGGRQKPNDLTAWIAPNPSRGAALIEFNITAPGFMSAEIYDARGALVKSLFEREVGPGRGLVMWSRRDGSGAEVSPGVYFCRIAALGQERVLKFVLLR